MAPIRFFLDEDIYGAIAVSLRRLGIDAISTPEAGRLGETDESQLRWARNEGRVLVTFNVADFARLHVQWGRQGTDHAGIAVSQQRPIGELLGRLIRLAGAEEQEGMRNRLEFLSDW